MICKNILQDYAIFNLRLLNLATFKLINN